MGWQKSKLLSQGSSLKFTYVVKLSFLTNGLDHLPVPCCEVLFADFKWCLSTWWFLLLQATPSCSNLLRVALRCSKLLRVAPSCSELLRVPPSCSEFLWVALSCSELLRVAPSCYEFTLLTNRPDHLPVPCYEVHFAHFKWFLSTWWLIYGH